jgi:hypothetical protein
MKTFHCTTGPKGNQVHETVELLGVLENAEMKPKLAEQAARVAFGHRNGVTVWDNERRHGYRLYANTARKLSQS